MKSILITGCSSGIGLDTALSFRDAGWRVIARCRKKKDCQVMQTKHNMHSVLIDYANEGSITKGFTDALEYTGGQLDVLFNNGAYGIPALVEDLPTPALRAIFETNFFAPLRLSKGLVSALSRGNGSIVNVTSIAGHKVHPFASSAYSSSKAALSALTREMANEFSGLNVRVNAVAPGEISTDMIQPEYEMLIPRIPLNRMGSARDVANTIFFLCSEEANYLTGTEIWVTGGQHMY